MSKEILRRDLLGAAGAIGVFAALFSRDLQAECPDDGGPTIADAICMVESLKGHGGAAGVLIPAYPGDVPTPIFARVDDPTSKPALFLLYGADLKDCEVGFYNILDGHWADVSGVKNVEAFQANGNSVWIGRMGDVNFEQKKGLYQPVAKATGNGSPWIPAMNTILLV